MRSQNIFYKKRQKNIYLLDFCQPFPNFLIFNRNVLFWSIAGLLSKNQHLAWPKDCNVILEIEVAQKIMESELLVSVYKNKVGLVKQSRDKKQLKYFQYSK